MWKLGFGGIHGPPIAPTRPPTDRFDRSKILTRQCLGNPKQSLSFCTSFSNWKSRWNFDFKLGVLYSSIATTSHKLVSMINDIAKHERKTSKERGREGHSRFPAFPLPVWVASSTTWARAAETMGYVRWYSHQSFPDNRQGWPSYLFSASPKPMVSGRQGHSIKDWSISPPVATTGRSSGQ